MNGNAWDTIRHMYQGERGSNQALKRAWLLFFPMPGHAAGEPR